MKGALDVDTNARPVDSFVGNYTSSALTYYRPCPICGSLRYRVVLELMDFQFFTDSTDVPKRVDVRQVQCLDCFALYQNPCYSTFGFEVLFAEAGHSYGSTTARPVEQAEWLRVRNLLRPGMQVLDVGCYDGSFLARLPKDVRKLGVDIEAFAIERGRQQYAIEGIEFILGDYETFQYSGTIDLITMLHVLEHLPRPVDALRKLRSLAHEGTRLLLEVPILEKGATNDINGFLSAQHMTHFSRRSLENCLARAGWRTCEQQEQLEYNGYRVLAEPSEPLLKVDGEPEDTGLLHAYLAAWHSTLLSVWRKLASLPEMRQVVLWGGGMHTEFLYHTTPWFHAGKDRKYLIVDSDTLKHGKTWRGVPIYPPPVLKGIDWNTTMLVISSYGSQEAIASAATDYGVPSEKIVRLYDSVYAY